jgi:hypothetical protein
MRILFVLMFLLGLCFNMQAQETRKKSRKELRAEQAAITAANVDSVMNSEQYTFMARTASSINMQQVQLSSGYDMTVRGDSVFVYLPYFGVIYRAGFDNDGGVRLNTSMEEYEIEKRKSAYEIKFMARKDGDTYRFDMSVSTSGYCSLVINSNNRQAITYTGILKDAEQ